VRAPTAKRSQFLAVARQAQVSNEKQFNDLYLDNLLAMDPLLVPPRAVTNKPPSNYYVVAQTGRTVVVVPQGQTAIIVFNPYNQVGAFQPAPITADVVPSTTLLSALSVPQIDTTASYYPSDVSSVFGYAQPDTDGTSDFCPLKGRMVIDCQGGNSVGPMPMITACGLADFQLQCGYTGAPAAFTNGNWYDATKGTLIVPNLSGNTSLLATSIQNHASSLVPAKNAKAGVVYFQPVMDKSQGDTFRTGNSQAEWNLLPGGAGDYPNHLGYGTSTTSCVQPHFIVTNNTGAGDDLRVFVHTTVSYAVPATPQQGRSFPLYIHT